MSKELDLIKRQQPEIIDGFPTGNIYIGVTKEELTKLEKGLEDLDTIKKIFDDYGLSFKLTTLREAILLIKQYQGSYGIRGQALITKKLKALDIIKNIGILKPYETVGGQCWLETMCDATKITKGNCDLLKEVGL